MPALVTDKRNEVFPSLEYGAVGIDMLLTLLETLILEMYPVKYTPRPPEAVDKPICEVEFCPAAAIPYHVPVPDEEPFIYSVTTPPDIVQATYVHVFNGTVPELVTLLCVPSKCVKIRLPEPLIPKSR
jgi:hypothetical protein